MALNSIFDFSTTPASNVDIGGVGILGSSLLSTADNSFRTLAALLAGYNKDLVGIGQTLGGTANAITLTVNQTWGAIASGQLIGFRYTVGPNTGAVAIVVTDGGGATFASKAIVANGGAALTGGEMLDNGIYWIIYDGTSYVLVNGGGFAGTLTSTDAGASAAPILTLYRDSATPATNDVLGQLLFNGEDSAGNTQEYASIQAVIADATSASEDGTLDFYLPVAGSRTKVLSITGPAIATAAEWRTGTSTTKLLGVSETWGAAAWVNLGASLTGNLTIDFATGINFYGTATGNITFNAVSNAKEQSGEFMITASGGDRTVSFNTTPFATPNNASLGTITSATTMLFSYTRAQNGKFVISAIGTVS